LNLSAFFDAKVSLFCVLFQDGLEEKELTDDVKGDEPDPAGACAKAGTGPEKERLK